MTDRELKPCPMCGSDANVTGNGRDYWVECESCLASSNYHENRDMVITLWNRRTLPDREAIIEECAKACEAWSASIDTGKKRNRVVAAAMQGALTCAEAIRQMKTAPNGKKGDS